MPNESFLQFLLDKACRRQIPASGTLELTARCNLSCRMCYIHKKENDPIALSKERPTEYWLDMIEQTRQAGTLTMLITGGEPFLRKDFKEIYLACKKAGFIVSVNTNGTLITPEYIELFKKYPPAKLNISLYGASYESYEKLCGIGQMFDRVSQTIRALCEAGISVKLNYTVTEFNHADAAKVYAFAKELKLRVQHTSYLFPAVRAAENGECATCRVSPEQAAAFMVECDREKYSAQDFYARAKACAQGCLLPCEPDEDSLRSEQERIFCRAGVSSYWLTYDGRILPCGMLQAPSFEIDRPFSELWQELKVQTAKINLPKKCISCQKRPYCEVCAASCSAETGSHDAVPTYLCQKTHAYLEQMKKIYEEEAHEAQ